MTDFNASNRKDIRKAEKASALQSLQDAEAVTAIMTTIPGRAWMWRLLSQAHIFDPNVIPDIRLASIWDGERNFGLRLLADIMRHCPEQYLQMTREASDNDRHHSDDRSPASERRSGEEPDGGDSGQDPDAAAGPGVEWDPYAEGAGSSH